MPYPCPVEFIPSVTGYGPAVSYHKLFTGFWQPLHKDTKLFTGNLSRRHNELCLGIGGTMNTLEGHIPFVIKTARIIKVSYLSYFTRECYPVPYRVLQSFTNRCHPDFSRHHDFFRLFSNRFHTQNKSVSSRLSDRVPNDYTCNFLKISSGGIRYMIKGKFV